MCSEAAIKKTKKPTIPKGSVWVKPARPVPLIGAIRLARSGTLRKPNGYDERDRSGRLAAPSPPPGFHGVAIAGLPCRRPAATTNSRYCFASSCDLLIALTRLQCGLSCSMVDCCRVLQSLQVCQVCLLIYLSKSPQQQHFALVTPSCNCKRQSAHTITTCICALQYSSQ